MRFGEGPSEHKAAEMACISEIGRSARFALEISWRGLSPQKY